MTEAETAGHLSGPEAITPVAAIASLRNTSRRH